MNMTTQLTMFGGKTEAEKFVPYASGDVLVTKPFGRVIIVAVYEDAVGRGVFGCVRQADGRECMVLEREVEYRSR